MTAFSLRSGKVYLHAANPVVSKNLSLGHFKGHQYFLKRGEWPGHQHTLYADMRFLQGKRQIIYVNQEQEWTKTRALGNSTIYSPHIRGGAIHPAELFTIFQV